MDKGDERVLANIEEYGCHIMQVMEENDSPPFSYSIGIWKQTNAPELIVIGLKEVIAGFVVNEYNRCVREGIRFKDGQMSEGFLEGHECLFREMDKSHYENYLGWDRWLYEGNDFPTLQLIYPTTSGIWPWQDDAPDGFKAWQPLLQPAPIQ